MATPPLFRPPTPQPLLHRPPQNPSSSHKKPQKYIILLLAPTSTAGKIQIAKSVASALSCPLFQGDSLHKVCAKAASVGFLKDEGKDGREEEKRFNTERYERMWLSKMTRTGLLFPKESRAASGGFEAFTKLPASALSSRRGSASSVEMSISSTSTSDSEEFGTGSLGPVSSLSSAPRIGFINIPVQIHPLGSGKDEREGKDDKALMVLNHPEIEKWCRESIRKIVWQYGIGVIFVPLYEEELPVLDSRTMTSFGGLRSTGCNEEVAVVGEIEIVLRVDIKANVEEIIHEIVQGVREIMNT